MKTDELIEMITKEELLKLEKEGNAKFTPFGDNNYYICKVGNIYYYNRRGDDYYYILRKV